MGAAVPDGGVPAAVMLHSGTGYMSRQIRQLRTDKFDRETHGNFDSCNSCKRHESKFPFVSRIEFIRSKLSMFYAHVSGFRGQCRHEMVGPLSASCAANRKHAERLPTRGEIDGA